MEQDSNEPTIDNYRVINTLSGQGEGMKVFGIICLLAALVPVQPTGADVYRYTDQHGNEIHTNDLNKVPIGQREGAKVSDGDNLVTPSSDKESISADSAGLPDGKDSELKEEQLELEALKSKLREEFNALAEENARLKAEQKAAVTPAQRKAFNKQVVSFNTRFQAYKEKEAVYKTRLEHYNKRLKAETSNPDSR